jgi:hypothetical protein
MAMNSVSGVLDPSVARSLAGELRACAAVYVGLDGAEPGTDAGEDLGLRWRRLASRLTAQGADEASVAVISRYLSQQPAAPARCAAFATEGKLLFAETLPGPAQPDLARFGAPPDVVPLLSWSQRHPPYVVVVTDRTGADVTAVPGGAVAGSTSKVVGPDDEIERNAPGGYGHRPNSADNSWHNPLPWGGHGSAQGRRLAAAVAGDVRACCSVALPADIRRESPHRPGGPGQL